MLAGNTVYIIKQILKEGSHFREVKGQHYSGETGKTDKIARQLVASKSPRK